MAVFSYGLTNPCSFKIGQTPVDNSFYYVVKNNFDHYSSIYVCKSTKDIANTSNWKKISLSNDSSASSWESLVIGKDKIINYTKASTSTLGYQYLSNINTGWVSKSVSVGSSAGVSKIDYSPELDLYVLGNSGGIWTSSNGISWTKKNSNNGANITWCHDRFISSGNYYSTNGSSWSSLPSSSYKPTVAILGAFNINGTWKTYGIGRNTSSPYLAYLVSYVNGGSNGFAYDKSATVPNLGPYNQIEKIEVNINTNKMVTYNRDSSYNTPRIYDLSSKTQSNFVSSSKSSWPPEYILANPNDNNFLQVMEITRNSSGIKVFSNSSELHSYSGVPISGVTFGGSNYSYIYSSLLNQNHAFFTIPTSLAKKLGIE